jgi:renalase
LLLRRERYYNVSGETARDVGVALSWVVLMEEIVVIGAGIAGLSLARELERAGKRPVVLEKSRGVGGRVATRRVEGQPVDHGVLFLHGSDPDFLGALEAVEATPLDGWPYRVEGEGRPCQPQAFRPTQRRVAFAEGVTSFPKSLARGLDVRPESRVRSIELRSDFIETVVEDGESVASRSLVLALPLEQSVALLAPLGADRVPLRAASSLLAMLASEPCLTLIAGYELDAPAPDWDVLYPSDGAVLLLVSHDSAKRSETQYRVLVYQCTVQFSRCHLEDDFSVWVPLVLEEASKLVGRWASRPVFRHPHRWRYSRVSSANTLSQPLWISLASDMHVGIAGESFHPGGGVEAAFVSEKRLADMILGVNRA